MVQLVTGHFVPRSLRTSSVMISYLLFGHIVPSNSHACVQGSTNGTNGITISFKVLPMVPLVITLVPMVMSMVPLALPMVPLVQLVSQWYHWLPMGYEWATNGTIGKITNGTIGRTPNRANIVPRSFRTHFGHFVPSSTGYEMTFECQFLPKSFYTYFGHFVPRSFRT